VAGVRAVTTWTVGTVSPATVNRAPTGTAFGLIVFTETVSNVSVVSLTVGAAVDTAVPANPS
jgi:hypothetical protein